jgi:hypothetical protein
MHVLSTIPGSRAILRRKRNNLRGGHTHRIVFIAFPLLSLRVVQLANADEAEGRQAAALVNYAPPHR